MDIQVISRRISLKFKRLLIYIYEYIIGYIEIHRIRKLIKTKRIKNYAIKLRNSGLGDQFLCGNASAKISEILGLQFIGIDSSSIHDEKAHRQCYLEAYGFLAIYDLPLLDSQEILILNNDNIVKNFSEVTRNISTSISKLKEPLNTLYIDMNTGTANRSLKFLNNKKGNYLVNQFSSCIKSNFQSLDLYRQEKIKVLFHLRLGDVANLEIVKGKVFVPRYHIINDYSKFLIDTKEIINDSRYDRREEFEFLSKHLYSIFDQEIKMVMITDGYDFPLEYLSEQPDLIELFKTHGFNYDNNQSEQLKQQFKTKFFKQFDFFEDIIYGEGAGKLENSMESLLSSDMIISSNGHFPLSILNNLGGREQTLFSSHKAPEMTVLRDGLTVIPFSNSIKADTHKITHIIQQWSASISNMQ